MLIILKSKKWRDLQVINEYKKARAVLAGMEATGRGSVWQNLFQEVEKVPSLPCVALH